ncbi:MAG TPA: molybdopterin dinucleotide binding domain-containing protein [Polyangium sp.]|nr:molybdopterin dinucleotide binding domain-containing protein [Polyangium sp.]
MAEPHPTFCRICEALCGLEADVEGGRVVALRPDARHVATEGFACPKGLKQHRMYASPDRVRSPLARRGERFEPASWDAALSERGQAEARHAAAGHDAQLVTHNLEDFAEPDGGTNHLYVHPEDAKRIGLSDGDLADVSTDVATVRVPVRLLADLMPGTVALPHGWGHQHAVGLSVARTTRGVNVNLLAADGPERLERVSGMAHLTGFVVDVVPARGPKNDRSWSGLPEETT